MNKGFTLIELLVVVLIIGILAAVALPQYTKAVERSRISEAVQALGDLATAQSIYYMQHDTFANSIATLNTGDITFPTVTSGEGDSQTTSYSGANSFNISVAGTDTTATLTAARKDGMYGPAADGTGAGTLTLTVSQDGSIGKSCTPAGGDFCKLAAAAGY